MLRRLAVREKSSRHSVFSEMISFGRQFSICSDHQLLKYLYNESRQIPVMTSSRIQCWALTLGAYKYAIQHKPGSKMAQADGLSCLPLPHKP